MSTILWAGSEESFDAVCKAEKKVEEAIASGRLSGPYASSNRDQLPPVTEIMGSTGVVHIKGSLIDGEAGWLRNYNVLGYTDIANAALELTANPDVKSILYYVRSPGGNVNGMYETAKLISQLSTIKSSATFTDTLMASAGYALGSAVKGPHLAGMVAEVGSIGVLQIHTEYSKMYDQEGITRTILRSGDNKALFNSIEPLSAEARDQAEEQLKDVHDIFKQLVVSNRPNMTAEQKSGSLDGKTFIGKRAVEAGLVDKVATFDQALKLLDIQAKKQHNPKNMKGADMHTTLSNEQLAALAAGATLASLGLSGATSATSQDSSISAEDKAKAEAEAATKAKEEADRVALAAKATAPTTTTSTDPAPAQAQLNVLMAQLVESQAKNLNLQASLDAQKASNEALLAIAREAAANLSVALGGSRALFATMEAQAVVAEFARLQPIFKAKLPVGQQSRSASDASTVVAVDPKFQAMCAAAPGNQSK